MRSLRVFNREKCLLLALILVICSCCCTAFSPSAKTPFCFRLFMGKGFNSARNKQAELAKKMKLAKKQQGGTDDTKEREDTKLKEDRAEFAQLLAESQPVRSERTFTESESTVTTPAKRKPKKQVAQKRRKKASSVSQENTEEEEKFPLTEGGTAKRRHFETLVTMETSQPLGGIGAAQLVPWVPPYLTSYLVVLADPRRQSGDLRQSIQYLTSNLSPEVLSQIVAITADTVDETAAWMNRAQVDGTAIRLFSDQKLEWMRMYSAVVDDERWSMSIFVFDTNGIIRKCQRQVDPSETSQLVSVFVESMQE